jgi:ubiquinone/menaquinone biosynthesis C-methylase UbiE
MIELDKWRKKNPCSFGGDSYTKALGILEIPTGSKVLDVGCADGAVRNCLPPDIEYFGVDPKPGIDTPNIKEGVAEDIPFGDESFDYVISIASLFHFMNLEKAFSEMVRVLRSGGILAMFVIIKGESDPDSKSHTFRLTHEIMDELAAMSGLGTAIKTEVPELKSWFYRWQK